MAETTASTGLPCDGAGPNVGGGMSDRPVNSDLPAESDLPGDRCFTFETIVNGIRVALTVEPRHVEEDATWTSLGALEVGGVAAVTPSTQRFARRIRLDLRRSDAPPTPSGSRGHARAPESPDDNPVARDRNRRYRKRKGKRS